MDAHTHARTHAPTHPHTHTHTHTQVDLVEIKQAFLGAYQKQLSTFVKGDTSGDYRKVLLAVIGDEPQFDEVEIISFYFVSQLGNNIHV